MIVVAGTVCLDRVRQIAGLPVIGGYVDAEPIGEYLGGEAANTACALQTWGADVLLETHAIGQDFAAQKIAQRIAELGLRANIPVDPSRKTPYCEIFVDSNGERTMFGFGFINLDAAKIEWEFEGDVNDWFSLDQNLTNSGAKALDRALSMGMQVYLLDHFRAECRIPPGSWWQCSTDWVGVPGDMDANRRWAEQFANAHQCHCLLSDGVLGFCHSSCGEMSRWYPSYQIPNVVDATGAGDIFRAGMLFGLTQAWNSTDCFRFAAAAGALQCLTYGATGSLPSVDAVQALITEQQDISAQFD